MSVGNLFSFSGRMTRGPLWLLILVGFGISIVVSVVINLSASGLVVANGPDGVATPSPLALTVFGLVGLVLGIINLSFQVRRCHDRDRSGWFVLLWCLPILNIWGFIEMYCLSGTVGTNRFGPDPLRRNLAYTAETFR